MISMNFQYIRINNLLQDKRISIISPSLKLQKDDINDFGKTAVISQDKEFISGYTDLIDKKLVEGSFTIFGDHTEIFKFIDFPFAQGADGIKILKADDRTIASKYLYYSLKNCYYPTGFYQRHFKLLRKTYIPDLDINHQKQIVTVLNNYDQLIENNSKRIELLESMAEELYKEWFVRLRFPGHKETDLKKQSARGWCFGDREDGQDIPVNWNFDELVNIAEFKRGRNITSSEMIEGEVPVIAAGLEPSGYHNQSNVNGYSLTISASGANAGYLAYHLEDIWAADCSYYQNDENLWFVYNALKFLQPVISNMQVGSAQPHVYAKNINRLSTIIPTNEWIKKYIDKVKPIYEEIKILNDKNGLLIKQRDSLLPRLMSGKLSVEGKEVI